MQNAWWKRFIYGLPVFIAAIFFIACQRPAKSAHAEKPVEDGAWVAPDIQAAADITPATRQQLLYGADLIAHTAKYFGPKGSINHTTNGMNCQNCHLDAGRKSWGNNYGGVAANYPRFNGRSGKIQTIFGRINDCFQRSLNGKAQDTASAEMRAMFAYIKWLGKKLPLHTKPVGSAIEKQPYLSRAASVEKGQVVYAAKCAVCHGKEGGGLLNATGTEYAYPPLWGPNSYNNGAGLYRLSGFTGFVKNNMPYLQATHAAPVLTNEQAWDVAAFVNSQPRPLFNQQADWRNIAQKPIDFPFGPYADTFTEQQHKYGPFIPIAAAKK